MPNPTFLAWLEPHYPNAEGVAELAELAATQVALPLANGARAVTVVCEPGGGWRYACVFTLINDPAFGGDLLLSLPEFQVCCLLDALGFHVPGYLAEKLPVLAPAGTAFLAALTSEVSARYGAATAAAPSEAP